MPSKRRRREAAEQRRHATSNDRAPRSASRSSLPEPFIPPPAFDPNSADQYARRLMPDAADRPEFHLPRISGRLREDYRWLPAPRIVEHALTAQWNSVALFFNLSTVAPAYYKTTTEADARTWLDEGTDPCDPPLPEFLAHYWATLSYGQLSFGIDTPRDAGGQPSIPTIAAPNGKAGDWPGLITECITANAEAVWQAAGGLIKNGKRWIPSVVLIQNYPTQPQAIGGYELAVDGHAYVVGDRTHLRYSTTKWSPPDAPEKTGRTFWGLLCHEYAHNFLEFGDLYGPQGCTGYWDLLGDNSPPGRMSEVSAHIKERAGWLTYKGVIEGPTFGPVELSLKPYTDTGEAYKIVPDPEHTPDEFFLLEYRTSTGNEVWRPDGALPDGGLLVTHVNNRLGVPPLWLLRDAPFLDPEFADASDQGGTKWTGHDDIAGKLFRHDGKTSFTAATTPGSDLYGDRPSGLTITNIRLSRGRVRFSLALLGHFEVGWTVSDEDRALSGSFTDESIDGGEEVFIRNAGDAALLVHRQSQWLVVRGESDWIGQWQLGAADRELVGDFDGDGFDEIYVRSAQSAGVIKWQRSCFRSLTVQHDWIGEWQLAPDDRQIVGDFDGDGRDEIYICGPESAAVIKLVGGQLTLRSMRHVSIGGLLLGEANSEFVGRFTQKTADEILMRGPKWIGLMYWDQQQQRLRPRTIQYNHVEGWNLDDADEYVIGDFDGDGLDEIYLRSASSAGVIKWENGQFVLLWMRSNDLADINGNDELAIAIAPSDRSSGGRFLPDRDGVLHRHSSGVAVLTWEASEMRVRLQLKSPFNGRWDLDDADRFALGDFHRSGMDLGSPDLEYVQDGLTDVFIHNGWGTCTIAVNHTAHKPWEPTNIREEMGLTWIQQEVLMRQG